MIIVEDETDQEGANLEELINVLEQYFQAYFALIEEHKAKLVSSRNLDRETKLAQDIQSIQQWLEEGHEKLIQQDDQAVLDDADSFKARAEGVLVSISFLEFSHQLLTAIVFFSHDNELGSCLICGLAIVYR